LIDDCDAAGVRGYFGVPGTGGQKFSQMQQVTKLKQIFS